MNATQLNDLFFMYFKNVVKFTKETNVKFEILLGFHSPVQLMLKNICFTPLKLSVVSIGLT